MKSEVSKPCGHKNLSLMSVLLSTQFSSVLPAQKGGLKNQINESWEIMFYLSYKGVNSQNQWINLSQIDEENSTINFLWCLLSKYLLSGIKTLFFLFSSISEANRILESSQVCEVRVRWVFWCARWDKFAKDQLPSLATLPPSQWNI